MTANVFDSEPVQGQLKTWCGDVEKLWRFIAKFSKHDAVEESRTYYVWATCDPEMFTWTRMPLTPRRQHAFGLTLLEHRQFQAGRPAFALVP